MGSLDRGGQAASAVLRGRALGGGEGVGGQCGEQQMVASWQEGEGRTLSPGSGRAYVYGRGFGIRRLVLGVLVL